MSNEETVDIVYQMVLDERALLFGLESDARPETPERNVADWELYQNTRDASNGANEAFRPNRSTCSAGGSPKLMQR